MTHDSVVIMFIKFSACSNLLSLVPYIQAQVGGGPMLLGPHASYGRDGETHSASQRPTAEES